METNRWHQQFGAPWPLGVRWIASERAYNFALYSQHATAVELLFFTAAQPRTPVYQVVLHPGEHRSGPIWHARLSADQLQGAEYYAYRVDGPRPAGGFEIHHFDREKLLLDPYARDVYFPPEFDRQAAIRPGDNLGQAPLGVLPIEERHFHWDGDRSLRHGADLIIYEVHVRGFTQHASSQVAPERRGTFLGVIDKIPYLQQLGITAVEFLPVFQFDTSDGNYWGYMPINFFAPHAAYASQSAAEDQHSEFREMVKALHAAGIEVILDVVYNHTGEGDHRGPTYSLKGIAVSTYYLLTGNPAEPFANYSGTGNTLHTANRATRQLIVDSLRYWVKEMHVDGFRFDLASIFTRGPDGQISASEPPIFGQIAGDPDLAGVRLIAEPWDIGAYQLGSRFPGTQWLQWNSAYQRCIRRAVRGDEGMIAELMTRLHGSSDLFPEALPFALRPFQSVNYVTSHDGFTLYDLVSYNQRHNEANGHGGEDGQRDDSWNCGSEGDSQLTDSVLELRKRQTRNMFALLMLSAGTPMFRMGDEFLQTQSGNNNPYNQDNATSWLNWERLQQHADFTAFCRGMIAFRKAHSSLCRSTFWNADIRWYGVELAPDISHGSRCLAYCLHGTSDDPIDLYVLFNGQAVEQTFGIFERGPGQWRKVIDTGLPHPQDLLDEQTAPLVQDRYLRLAPRSLVVLCSIANAPSGHPSAG